MNTCLTNQLEDVKNDLKYLEKKHHQTVSEMMEMNEEGDLTYKEQEVWIETEKQKDIDYLLKKKEIKTKLQKYHEWASEEEFKLVIYHRDIINFLLNNGFDEKPKVIDNINQDIEELSTFISEVEKLAKDNGVELK